MLRTLIARIRAIPALLNRVRTEPVMLVALVMIVLTAYQEAVAGSLGAEDTLIFVAEAILGWFARELVVPTAKLPSTVTDQWVVSDSPQPVYTGEPDGEA